MELSMVSTSERPDLVPVVADWLWKAFWAGSGKPFDVLLLAVRRSSATTSVIPSTFILLADGEPAGTASLVAHDLEERPDLTPWLAGVFVEPRMRGRHYAGYLISAVEQAARSASVSTLWLYTNTAERIYARAGWRTVDTVVHHGKPFAVMKRDLLV